VNDDWGTFSVWQQHPVTTSMAKVTIVVNVPLTQAVSPNGVMLLALQYVAKSVVDNDNDTYKAMHAAGWQASLETGIF
jgi:hypothetical protein